jgi:hypothetical protein
MTRTNTSLHRHPAFNRFLLVVGTLGLLMTSAQTAQTRSPEGRDRATESVKLRDSSLLAQRIPNYCRKGESTFLTMETKNFWISICGGDNPDSYVGVNKKNRQSIRLPLKDFDPRGTFFHAVNKDVDYILAQTPKGKFLTVSKANRELLREPVIKGW